MTECIRCGAPTDGYTCQRCGVDKPRGWLEEITEAVPAARDIAHGLTRHGDGGASGKPESRLPLDLSVTARLDSVQNALNGWVRVICDQRGWDVTRALKGSYT